MCRMFELPSVPIFLYLKLWVSNTIEFKNSWDFKLVSILEGLRPIGLGDCGSQIGMVRDLHGL
jgi:hypothetical protein